MPLNAEPAHFPRMKGQQADVVPGSPLAVVALFTEVVRQRFRPGNGLAWVWEENATPRASEENTIDAPRKIMVEPSFNTQLEASDYRPFVCVDKGETTPSNSVVDNFIGQNIPSGLRGFYSLATIPMELTVVSDKKGECATLADIVWFYILASRDLIAQTFGLHEVSNPILGRTVPYEVDKKAWETKIIFNAMIHLRWTTLPISPLLKSIVANYKKSGEENPDTYLLKQYIRSP